MLECPHCDKLAYNGYSCAACGFKVGPTRGGQPLDPMHLICCDVRDGQRCAEPGTLSETIFHGGKAGDPHPGPWYCAKHFPPFAGRFAPKAAPPQGFKALKDVLRKAAIDPEAEAERRAIQSPDA